MTRPAPAPTTSACRSCGATVIWAVTVNGRSMPIDAEPAPTGNVILRARGRGEAPLAEVHAGPVADQLDSDGTPGHLPHHATCPDGPAWQKKRGRR